MDRLSCLPDEVICHILSFLRTKHYVQTSVLSKRWRFLWARVPCLEFCVNGRDQSINSKVINEIVLQLKHDIHTFRLYLKNEYHCASEEELESWIVNITTRNIRNLVIDLVNQYVLPQCIFTCRTLVYLSLVRSKHIPTSGVYFPVLKKLQLSLVQYQSHESLTHLISGCPMLEELSIFGKVLGHCCVSSPTLTRLELILDFDAFSNFGVKLDTPALRYLKLSSSVPNEFLVGALDSLIEAHLLLSWEEDHQDDLIFSLNVLSFVSKLHNVKLLTLTTDRVVVLHDSLFSGCPIKFNNLTELDLKVYSNLAFVTCFLENADNLRILCLEILSMDDIDDPWYWMEPKQVPNCLISHLRKVIMRHFWCSMEEFGMVRYILKNAKVLKRMEIICPGLNEQDWKKKFKAVKKLALFERRSKKCRLVFN